MLGNDKQRPVRLKILRFGALFGAFGVWGLFSAVSDVTGGRNDPFGVLLDVGTTVSGFVVAATCVIACRYVNEDGQPRRRRS
jgi:hypothetical protein